MTGSSRNAQRLSPKVREVAMLRITGRSTRQIAQKLGKSVKTVEAQVAKAHRVLGVRSQQEMVEKLRGRML